MVITERERKNLNRHAAYIIELAEGHPSRRRDVVASMPDDAVKAVASATRLAHHHGLIDDRWYRSRNRTIERMMAKRVAVRNKRRMIETGSGLFKHILQHVGHALKSVAHAAIHSKIGQDLITKGAAAVGSELGGVQGAQAAQSIAQSLLPSLGGGGGSSSSRAPPPPRPAPMPAPMPATPPPSRAPSRPPASRPAPAPASSSFSSFGEM